MDTIPQATVTQGRLLPAQDRQQRVATQAELLPLESSQTYIKQEYTSPTYCLYK